MPALPIAAGTTRVLAYLDQAFDVPFSMLPLDRRGAHGIVKILVEPLQEAPELPIPASIAEPAVAAPALTRDDHDEEDIVEALRLTMEEIAAIERVGALTLQSLRQARRLLTAYLLVRATVPHHDLGRFLGSAAARAAYRAVLAQLAIVVSAARLAPRYFRVLASANPGDVSALLGALAADCAVLSDGEWPVLQAVLEDYRAQGDDAEAIGDLIAWSPVAGRHSFAFAVDGR